MKIEADFLKEPETAVLFSAFEHSGFDLYFVGGCVRNALLGRNIHDLDLSTNATPIQMSEIAKKANLKIVPTGIDFGTMTFLVDKHAFEVTTFRRDVDTDGRRAVVSFSTSIDEDAIRRDFTMNAIYATRNGTILDPQRGLEDAIQGKIRFIKNPTDRIKEDYLRILRFFRFYAWYGDISSGLDQEGLAACATLADGLSMVSKERIGAEFLKLLSANDPGPSVAAMEHSGVLARILSGATAKFLPVFLDFSAELSNDPIHRLAAINSQDAKNELRIGNKLSKRLADLTFFIQEKQNPFEFGFALGSQDGLAGWMIRSAFLEQRPDPHHLALIERGANSDFPLKASDLMPGFSGADLGFAIKFATELWLKSHGNETTVSLVEQVKQND